ncbi:MAG: SirB2 family protein [Gammaproteobacteria bacterium]
MIEFYPQIRSLHLVTVVASGSLFLLRNLLVAAGRGGLALAPLPRYLSYAIDTLLLAAAITLVAILPAAVFSNGWLYGKLALLPVYIFLGFTALRSARGSVRQWVCLTGALLAFAGMWLIARAHDPLGPLRPLLGG